MSGGTIEVPSPEDICGSTDNIAIGTGAVKGLLLNW
jgi:hypothetical protein